jgi:DNA adenine methylase
VITHASGVGLQVSAGGPRPLLKWAGGKRQLLPEIRRFYPSTFNQYWEPFLGSGAVFFDLWASGRLSDHPVRLLDNNPDLMACYEAVRNAPDAVIAALERLAAERRRLGSAHYYEARDRRFNLIRMGLTSNASPREAQRSRRKPAHESLSDPQDLCAEETSSPIQYTPELAAMLIYLNRTGFTDLFRLNAAGGFNVPAGQYENPRIGNGDNIRAVAAALSQPGISLTCATFDRVLDEARAGDFSYFDPPYAPLTRTAQATSYTVGGFGYAEQRRLQAVVVELARRGCQVPLSNSTAPEISHLYERNDAAKAAGLRCYRVPARRAINSNASRHGPVVEFLITNIPHQ